IDDDNCGDDDDGDDMMGGGVPALLYNQETRISLKSGNKTTIAAIENSNFSPSKWRYGKPGQETSLYRVACFVPLPQFRLKAQKIRRVRVTNRGHMEAEKDPRFVGFSSI
ncbi:hypothetical protein COCVIDRAFT_103945, partial [Bipolaris victoriae FI3]